jgi:hypothetical protein
MHFLPTIAQPDSLHSRPSGAIYLSAKVSSGQHTALTSLKLWRFESLDRRCLPTISLVTETLLQGNIDPENEGLAIDFGLGT